MTDIPSHEGRIHRDPSGPLAVVILLALLIVPELVGEALNVDPTPAPDWRGNSGSLTIDQ